MSAPIERRRIDWKIATLKNFSRPPKKSVTLMRKCEREVKREESRRERERVHERERERERESA